MASLGVVSAVAGPLRFRGGGALDRYVQADVAMPPVFSGGPLVDSVRNLIGSNASTLGRAGQLTVSRPPSTPPWPRCFGMDGSAAVYWRRRPGRSPSGAAARALENGQDLGLLIVRVEAGGPADTAGSTLGDDPGRRRHHRRPGRAASGATRRGSRWQEHPHPYRPRRRATPDPSHRRRAPRQAE